jgi:hypothetical protein
VGISNTHKMWFFLWKLGGIFFNKIKNFLPSWNPCDECQFIPQTKENDVKWRK